MLRKTLYKLLGEEDNIKRTIFAWELMILTVLFNHKSRVSHSETNEDLLSKLMLNKILSRNSQESFSILFDIKEQHVKILELRSYSDN